MGATYTLLLSVVYLVCGVFIFLLGLTILRTGSLSTPTRATALMLFFAGLGPVLSATSIILQSTLKQDAVVYRSMVDNFEYLWEFYFPSLLLFSLSFPRENRLLQRVAIAGLLIYAPYVAHLITIIMGDGLFKNIVDAARHLPPEKQVAIGQRTVSLSGTGNIISIVLGALIKLHKPLFLLVNISYAAVALFFISRSLKHQPNPRIARQLKTVFAGLVVSIAGYILAKIAGRAGAENVSLALVNFSLVAGGGCVAYAVVKQQFLGIKYVARKSLLYGGAAVIFAVIYLFVVKPVSDYFGQYSMVSKNAFETGFIILAIIAFQPMLLRIEEILERVLLRGRDDLQVRFKELAGKISSAGGEKELEALLRSEFETILDASVVTLTSAGAEERAEQVAELLEKIGEPVTKRDLFKSAEKGRLFADQGAGEKSSKTSEKERMRKRREAAAELIGSDEVLVPIFRERKCVEFVSLGEKTYGLRYTSGELAQLSVISNQIGVALDNIRLLRENVEKKLIEEELKIARRIQSQLLPPSSPTIPGYDLSASTTPSRHVGGDYYDFDIIGGDALVIVVADVSGKGIPASLLMATLRAAVNSNADARKAPAVMLSRINTLLFKSTSPEEFATLFYGVVNLEDGVMRYSNAGHEFPFLVSEEGVCAIGESGIVAGCVESFPYEEFSCQIPRGGTVVFYTDGITDAATGDGENFGTDRLKKVLERNGFQSAGELCSSILSEVESFAKEGANLDDLTLVALKRE